MPEKILPIAQIMSILAATPPRLATLTADLISAQLKAAPGLEEWSANEVLAHLRACADVWGDCIARVINEDRPTIKALSPRTWIDRTDYRTQDFRPSLHAFTAQRADLLALLDSLTPETWSRTATVTGAGKPFVHTVHSYAQRLATHERPHVKQIERASSRSPGKLS